MTSTQKGDERVLKFVPYLSILLFLNNISIVLFCGWCVCVCVCVCVCKGEGVKKLVIFCARHKWMTPNNKLVNSYSNFLTVVHIGYNNENGDAHKSSKF